MARRWTEDEVEELVTLHARGVPLTLVAKALGRSYDSVSLKANKIGLTFTRADRRKVNPHVFRYLNPNRAWLLGLLFADGSWGGIRQSVNLTSIDRDVVIQARDVLESDYPIYERDPSSDDRCLGKRVQYRLYVNSKELVDSFEELGIPRLKKDRTSIPPMPKDLVRHFIRGYWDGDGGASAKSGHAYVAGPTPFIEELRSHLVEEVGITPSPIYIIKHTTGVASISVGRKPDIPLLFRYLYYQAECYSRRKYDNFVRLVNTLVAA